MSEWLADLTQKAWKRRPLLFMLGENGLFKESLGIKGIILHDLELGNTF